MADISVRFGAEEQVSKVAEEVAKSIEKLEEKVEDAGKASRKAAPEIERVPAAVHKITPEVAAANDRIDLLISSLRNANTAGGDFRERVDRLEQPVGDMVGVFDRLAGSSGALGNTWGMLVKDGIAAFATGGAISLGIAGLAAGVAAVVSYAQELSQLNAQEKFLGLDPAVLERITAAFPDLERSSVLALAATGKEAGLTTEDIVTLGREAEKVAAMTGVAFDEAAVPALERMGLTADRVREKVRAYFAELNAQEAGAAGLFSADEFDKAIDNLSSLTNQIEDVRGQLNALRDARDAGEISAGSAQLEIDRLEAEKVRLSAERARAEAAVDSILAGENEALERKAQTEAETEAEKDRARKAEEDRRKREQAAARAAQDYAAARKALAEWDFARAFAHDAEIGRIEKERAAVLEQARLAGELGARRAEINAHFDAKAAEATALAEDKKIRKYQDTEARLAEIYAGDDAFALLQAKHNRELLEFERWAADAKLSIDEVKNARDAVLGRQSAEEAAYFEQEAEKSKAAREKVAAEAEKQADAIARQNERIAQIGMTWATNLAQGFAQALEDGDASQLFGTALQGIMQLIAASTGGVGGIALGGVGGILGAFLRDGGHVGQIELPKARRGMAFADLDADGVLLEGHRGEVVLNAQAVSRHGGAAEVNRANTERDYMIGGRREAASRLVVEVHALDAVGTAEALRRTVEPAQADRFNYRQGGLLREKLSQGRRF